MIDKYEGFGNSYLELVEYMENGRSASQQNEHNFRYPIDNTPFQILKHQRNA